MEDSFRILVVEDHPLTRLGFKLGISRNFPSSEIVGEMESVAVTLDFLQQNPAVDLMLLDITLTDGSSLPVAKFVKQSMPKTKILVCSMNSSYTDIIKFVELGVDGFISKFSDEAELTEAMSAVLNNEKYLGKDISDIIDIVGNANLRSDFTTREIEIIQLCAKGKRVKVIAEELGVSKRTIEAHKSNIFNKLGLKNTAEVVKYALENGIIRL